MAIAIYYGMNTNIKQGENKMTKKEISIKIASALLNADVDENNWKVKDLMKRSKSILEDHMKLADRINEPELPEIKPLIKIESDLNENEIKVLKSLVNSSSGNGHDFGFTDEYEECGFSKHQMAGYIGSLVKKDYLDVTDLSEDPGCECNSVQFTFTIIAENLLNNLGENVFVDCNHWND